jgi:hypothetical protein
LFLYREGVAERGEEVERLRAQRVVEESYLREVLRERLVDKR